jgi:HSP20 family protein
MSGLTVIKANPSITSYIVRTSETRDAPRIRVGPGTNAMAVVDPRTLMWTRACEMIDRAERLHRQFFQPMTTPAYVPSWEPPADVTSTDSEIRITVALPGVDPNDVKVSIDRDRILVTGFRRPCPMPRNCKVHRLEIPYGRFERQIAVPGTRLRLDHSEYANGCLVLSFSK